MKKRIFAVILCFAMIFGTFSYIGLGNNGIANAAINQSAKNTESEIPECDCNNGDKALVDHVATCAQRYYVQSTYVIGADGNVVDKSAADIYEEWDSMDKTIQQGILDLMQEAIDDKNTSQDDKTVLNDKLAELNNLLEGEASGGEESTVHEDENVKFEGTANSVKVNVFASQRAFPEGTEIAVKKIKIENDDEDAIKNVIKKLSNRMTVLGMYPVDISFSNNGSEQQPKESVALKLEIPKNKIPEDANKVVVIHMDGSKPEIVDEKYLVSGADSQSIIVRAESFSSYVAVFVNEKYQSKLMSDVLEGDSTYSIKNFKVDLFDYDGQKFNDVHKTTESFYFGGGSVTSYGGSGGINNSEQFAKQGILSDTLDSNGMPIINYSNGAKGEDVFSAKTAHAGKTVYPDVDFQFIYNKDTGYYEYKSASNHAEYNSAKNVIELYADTMSPANNDVTKLELNAGIANSSFKNGTVVATKNSFKGTVQGTSGSRLDPYITYNGLELAASNMDKIYIKAKIPASVGANTFEVYFKADEDEGFTTGKRFSVDYTPNGDWVEIVIDTTELTSWSGEITGLRIDPFDSAPDSGKLCSIDKSGSYPIEISEISFINNKTVEELYTQAGFYPFSPIANSYPGNGDAFDKTAWENSYNSSEIKSIASRSITNQTSSAMPIENLHYGTVMEFDCYIPVSKTASGEADKEGTDDNLRFEFTGDDDLWVYIDGELALDIGGGHGATYGYIDFTDGNAYVEKAVQVTGYNSHEGTGADPATKVLDDKLTKPGKHTIKIFYLERFATVSNCFMKFNLPQVPEGSVEVSKDVEVTTGTANNALKNQEYTFQITATDKGSSGGAVSMANKQYDIADVSAGISKGTTDNDGKFKLKDGQKAIFNIPENYEVTVTEIDGYNNNIAGFEYKSTTVTGNDKQAKSEKSLSQTTVKGQTSKYAFVNTYEPLYGSIKITKSGISDLDNNDRESQNTIYHVEGTSNSGEKVSLNVTIVGNSSKVIEHVPVGTYTVRENTDWSWRYNLSGTNGKEVTVKGNQQAEAEFVNNRTQKYWLSGDSYCKNWWGGSNNNISSTKLPASGSLFNN